MPVIEYICIIGTYNVYKNNRKIIICMTSFIIYKIVKNKKKGAEVWKYYNF